MPVTPRAVLSGVATAHLGAMALTEAYAHLPAAGAAYGAAWTIVGRIQRRLACLEETAR